MLNMRELTLQEEAYVSGADGGSVTVVGRRPPSTSTNTGPSDGGGWRRRANTDDADYDADDYNQDEEIVVAGWQKVALDVAKTILVTLAGNAAWDALSSDKESKVAAKFSAQSAQVIANVDGWDKNGQTVSGVLLNNGTTYWDMDRDGKFDLKFERDGAGNIYKDDGDGPVMVHGQG